MKKRKSQISMEYMIVIGFVTFIVIGILGIAIAYSGNIKDKIRMTQVINFANKIISTSESVFYAGHPSMATISGYLPQGVNDIEISENSIIFTITMSTGINKISFSSNVPITGSISDAYGIKKIRITADEDKAVISQA